MPRRSILGSIAALITNLAALVILVDAIMNGAPAILGVALLAAPVFGLGLLVREWARVLPRSAASKRLPLS